MTDFEGAMIGVLSGSIAGIIAGLLLASPDWRDTTLGARETREFYQVYRYVSFRVRQVLLRLGIPVAVVSAVLLVLSLLFT